MKKKTIKFFDIFDSLSINEKKQFIYFLKSKVSPKIRVSNAVLSHLNSKAGFEKYLNENFSSRSIWNICSELTKPLELFLAFKELNEDSDRLSELVSTQFNKRNLDKLLLLDYKNRINKLLNSKIDSQTFRKAGDIYGAFLKLTVKMRKVKLQRQVYQSFANFHTLTFFFETILEMINIETTNQIAEKNTSTLTEEFFPFLNFKSTMKSIKKFMPDIYSIVLLQYNIYELITGRKHIKHYPKIKSKFFSLMDRYTDEFNIVQFENLIDCLIFARENTGVEISNELFELFSKKVEAGLISDFASDKIGYNHFRDYVLIAIKVNEIDWAKNFVEKYSPLLPEKQRHNDVNTAQAMISFSAGNFINAIDAISKIKKTYYIHYNDFFRISIKANYELENFEECLSLSEKYRDYLRRTKKLRQNYVAGSMSFLKNVKRLINYKLSFGDCYLNEIEFDLRRNIQNSDSAWIEKKYYENFRKNPAVKVV